MTRHPLHLGSVADRRGRYLGRSGASQESRSPDVGCSIVMSEECVFIDPVTCLFKTTGCFAISCSDVVIQALRQRVELLHRSDGALHINRVRCLAPVSVYLSSARGSQCSLIYEPPSIS